MTQTQHAVRSVYISNRSSDDLAAIEWCRNTFAASHLGHGIEFKEPCWSFGYARVYIHRGCTVTVKELSVFEFANSRRKVLFDIRWGHLVIYDSVAALEADHPGTEHY